MNTNLIISETDEALMRSTLLKCYGKQPYTFRVSKEHYLYLAEQIISLREAYRRLEGSVAKSPAPENVG